MRNKACLAVLIVGLAAASEARAQICAYEKIRYRSEGDVLTADFTSVDRSTCNLGIETTVYVEGSVGEVYIEDQRCSPNGPTEVTDAVTNIVAVVISVYDRCQGVSLRSIMGTGTAEEFHASANRKTGSLRAAFVGTDESDQPVPITIDVVWNGVGRKERTSDQVNTHPGAFRLVHSSTGTIRDAAAAGSVTIDGIDITPLPSTRGTIEKNVAHGFEVWR